MRSFYLRWPIVAAVFMMPLAAPLIAQHTGEAPSMIEGPQVPGTPAPVKAADPALMDNDSVMRMHQAGLSDALIVQTIATQPGRYKTGPDDLIALTKAGLSEDVLSAMTMKARRPMTRAVEPQVDISPVNDIGVYYKDDSGRWQPMESEKIHTKTSGWIKNTLSDGIIKQDNNGIVSGPQSPLALHMPTEFLIYTGIGVEGSEYNVLKFRLTGKDREFRILTGGVFHSESGAKHDEIAVTAKRIAPHTWTIKLDRDNAGGGEFGILPPGTGNILNGGKIYTFAFIE